MEWMARRLRYIDGAGEIKEWAAAMSALNVVLKEVDFKDSSDIHICTIYETTRHGPVHPCFFTK